MRFSGFIHRRYIVVLVLSRAGSYFFSQYSYVHIKKPDSTNSTPLVDKKPLCSDDHRAYSSDRLYVSVVL
jgi:hypothetical protein